MNIALCDDELSELENVRHLVADYGIRKKLSIDVHCFQCGEELLLAIGKGCGFDVIFLDVIMGTDNGILVARRIREFDNKCSIIFATNSRDYALDAYGVKAVQYLLKPIGAKALEDALDLALEAQKAKIPKVIHIKTRQGDYNIPLEDILFAESDARIITIHLRSQEKISFYARLDNVENQCQDARFLRCHKSFLINLEHVRSIVNSSIILKTGDEVPVSMNISRAKAIFASYTAGRI